MRKTGICHFRELIIRSNWLFQQVDGTYMHLQIGTQKLVGEMEDGVCTSVVCSVGWWRSHRLWEYYRQAVLSTVVHLCILWLHNMWFSEHWTGRNLDSFQNSTQTVKDSVPNYFGSCIKYNITQQNNLV